MVNGHQRLTDQMSTSPLCEGAPECLLSTIPAFTIGAIAGQHDKGKFALYPLRVLAALRVQPASRRQVGFQYSTVVPVEVRILSRYVIPYPDLN